MPICPCEGSTRGRGQLTAGWIKKPRHASATRPGLVCGLFFPSLAPKGMFTNKEGLYIHDILANEFVKNVRRVLTEIIVQSACVKTIQSWKICQSTIYSSNPWCFPSKGPLSYEDMSIASKVEGWVYRPVWMTRCNRFRKHETHQDEVVLEMDVLDHYYSSRQSDSGWQ